MNAIADMNGQLDPLGLEYESYLQNLGRELFYIVAASYLTIYLAIIFLVVANTIIGVQFLMGQQKAARRYRTLVRLGAEHDTLCRAAKAQSTGTLGCRSAWRPVSSVFGVRALFTGMLTAQAQRGMDRSDDHRRSYDFAAVCGRMDLHGGRQALQQPASAGADGAGTRRITQKGDVAMKHIAVVEDEALMREELADMLRRAGYTVTEVTDFSDVTAAARARPRSGAAGPESAGGERISDLPALSSSAAPCRCWY